MTSLSIDNILIINSHFLGILKKIPMTHSPDILIAIFFSYHVDTFLSSFKGKSKLEKTPSPKSQSLCLLKSKKTWQLKIVKRRNLNIYILFFNYNAMKKFVSSYIAYAIPYCITKLVGNAFQNILLSDHTWIV